MEAAKVIQLDDQLMVKEFDIQEITQKNLDLMEKQILEIPEVPETKEQYDSAYRFNVDAKKLLPRIEERRKELKAPVLKKGKDIDATAKKATGMVQPLIEMSGSRRSAWEAAKEAEKVKKEYQADEIEAYIENCFMDLTTTIAAGMQYNLESDKIFLVLTALNKYHLSAVDFGDRIGEAEQLLEKGLGDVSTAYTNRTKFEEDQAEAARVKAENEAKEKELAEAQAKLEAERKVQEEEARKKAEAEAEKARIANEKLEADRLALEAEKRRLEEKEQARKQFLADHTESLEMHEQYKAVLEAEIDQARADAMERWKATEKAKAGAAERAKLVEPDKVLIKELAEGLYDFIAETHGVPVNFKTKEAEVLYLDMQVSLRRVVQAFENAGEELI